MGGTAGCRCPLNSGQERLGRAGTAAEEAGSYLPLTGLYTKSALSLPSGISILNLWSPR
jgi:hypothetical protein